METSSSTVLTPCQSFLQALSGSWTGHGNIEFQITQVLIGALNTELRDIPTVASRRPGRVSRENQQQQQQQQQQGSTKTSTPQKELFARLYCSHPDDSGVRFNSSTVFRCLGDREIRWTLHRNTAGVEIVHGLVDESGLKATLDSKNNSVGDGMTGTEDVLRTQYRWSIEPEQRKHAVVTTFLEKAGSGAKPGLNPWSTMNWSKGHI